MEKIIHTPNTLTICGVDFPVDSKGRVDLSQVNRSRRNARMSPAMWGHTARCRNVMRKLISQKGVDREDVWVVEGQRKIARTWVDPVIAEAYIEDLGLGEMSVGVLVKRITDLEERITDIENQMSALLGEDDEA